MTRVRIDRETTSSTAELIEVMTAAAARAGAAAVPPTVLTERADVLVLRVGAVVVKAHPAETDAAALLSRLRLASTPLTHGILLPPLPIGDALHTHAAGRTITAWRYGEPVDPDDPDAAPWEAAATLLARLHALPRAGDPLLARLHPPPGHDLPEAGDPLLPRLHPPPGHDLPEAGDPLLPRLHPPPGHDLPEAGGPARVHRAMRRLREAEVTDRAAETVVCQAFAVLPESFAAAPESAGLPESAAPRRTLVHGDFHLGQLVRADRADAGRWRLIDIDDLGSGDPAWDLARPAALFAAGILEPVTWLRFLDAYRAAGGVAVPREGDEWIALDTPARAVAVQAAALALVAAAREKRELDDLDTALVDACRRIATASVIS
ncbi:phosphotransferase [Nocardia bhagyanarayanae]|uniref:Aminoglycoside phosphotransferase domain-containing protein n=1 Tax=Nocardia bhagyanarayanae TaxID=1215925 RepID=A0A543FA08_9NOCA|nr:phosphotransferase [Nocardia bhagyanarayanae]TQM30666.1 hypothetical protein FB390_2301 [Nocardia bhagyanarayanae]